MACGSQRYRDDNRNISDGQPGKTGLFLKQTKRDSMNEKFIIKTENVVEWLLENTPKTSYVNERQELERIGVLSVDKMFCMMKDEIIVNKDVIPDDARLVQFDVEYDRLPHRTVLLYSYVYNVYDYDSVSYKFSLCEFDVDVERSQISL